jgi:hypothetical protein
MGHFMITPDLLFIGLKMDGLIYEPKSKNCNFPLLIYSVYTLRFEKYIGE